MVQIYGYRCLLDGGQILGGCGSELASLPFDALGLQSRHKVVEFCVHVLEGYARCSDASSISRKLFDWVVVPVVYFVLYAPTVA